METKTKEELKQEAFLHRVITMLNRQELDFLDKLGKDSLFSSGHKLTHNEILKVLINLAMEMGISVEKIGSREDLKERLMEKIRLSMPEPQKNEGKENEG